MSNYEQSAIYMTGVFYKTLGELLMDPKTDIRLLADFGHANGFDFDIRFKAKEALQPSTQEVSNER